MVDVAQLVEHQIVALVVVGSIPTIHPILRSYGASYGRPVFLAQSTLMLRSGAHIKKKFDIFFSLYRAPNRNEMKIGYKKLADH